MKYKALIFDYGGTIDSPGIHWSQLLLSAYQQHHIPVTPEQFREAYVHVERTLGRYDIIQPNFTFRKTLAVKLQRQMEYLSHFENSTASPNPSEGRGGVNGLLVRSPLPSEGLGEAVGILDSLYTATQQLTRHNRTILEQLREHYPLVLVSNFYGNLNTVLREFHLDGLFTHVIESAQVNIRKPDPAIYQLAVDSIGGPAEELLVVGDSIKNDILPAHSIGCHTAWLTTKDDTEGDVPCDYKIKTLDQLLDLLSPFAP